MINISSKKIYTIASDWNTRSDSSFAGNELVINSSFNVGNPLGVNVGQPYSLSGMYNLSTGKRQQASLKRLRIGKWDGTLNV